jgi:hypothetical protein
MTRSGCSAGSTEGNVTNLKADMFDDFADYLTEVTKYYHDKLGITFNYIEPFNEPEANWWKANGGQEGCYFSNADQIKMIRELYTKLQEKDMLTYCHINANDANTIDGGYSALQVYKTSPEILPMFDLISVHSYGGNSRTLLSSWAQSNNKKLWQSESGPLYVGDSYESQVMIMADRIITDLRDMKCTAWCDWQLGGTGDNLNNAWALIMSDYNDNLYPIARNTNYYSRAQFSRYIKAGFTIIGSSAKNSISAISPDNKELVLVISNSELSAQKYTIDLSEFSEFGKVKQFRTRAQESLGVKNSEERLTISGSSFTYDAQSESVTTFVIPINQSTTRSSNIEKYKGDIYYSSGNLYTNFTNANPIAVLVYNSAGQLIKTCKNVPARGVCQLELKNGIYLIFTSINNNQIARKIAVSN